MPIVGGAVDSFQIKNQMIFTSATSIGWGILCTFAINWVNPPANICTMCLFALRVGCPFPQHWRADLTLSRTGSQGVNSDVLFPIQAPKILTVFPSLAILISWGSVTPVTTNCIQYWRICPCAWSHSPHIYYRSPRSLAHHHYTTPMSYSTISCPHNPTQNTTRPHPNEHSCTRATTMLAFLNSH